MTSKDKLYKILSLGLTEIRGEANELMSEKTDNDEHKLRKIYAISHLVHNLPAKLNQSDANYDEILSKIIEAAEHNNKGLAEWLKSNFELTSKQ